jgi:hypothetical protein
LRQRELGMQVKMDERHVGANKATLGGFRKD